MKPISVRDEQAPERLVLLRFGVNTLGDDRLAKSCEESFAKMGVHAFSVFGLPPGGYEELARLVPVFVHRPKFLEAMPGRSWQQASHSCRPMPFPIGL